MRAHLTENLFLATKSSLQCVCFFPALVVAPRELEGRSKRVHCTGILYTVMCTGKRIQSNIHVYACAGLAVSGFRGQNMKCDMMCGSGSTLARVHRCGLNVPNTKNNLYVRVCVACVYARKGRRHSPRGRNDILIDYILHACEKLCTRQTHTRSK